MLTGGCPIVTRENDICDNWPPGRGKLGGYAVEQPLSTSLNTDMNPLHTSGTPLIVRGFFLGICMIAIAAVYVMPEAWGPRARAGVGVVFFISLIAACSADLRRVNLRTLICGFLLQLGLALLVLQVPAVERGLDATGNVVKKFIGFSDEGAKFVFGNLYDSKPPELGGTWSRLFPPREMKDKDGNTILDEKGKPKMEGTYFFQFAFVALPPILFVSAFFTVLYHFGVLQWIVRIMAKVMIYLMGTSGAETLSVSANVFMGQTEAPLIVKPYVPRMTMSELFTLMVSGMAHISGGMMAVYINYGANPTAVITTCIMACPCSLYIAKLMIPEIGRPETLGSAPVHEGDSPYVNAIDAAAAGTGDGLRLALNVAAMLIVFTAFVYLFNGLLSLFNTQWLMAQSWWPANFQLPDEITLRWIFGKMFAPIAALMGVDWNDTQTVGSLLGAKLSVNEHFAFLDAKVSGMLDKIDPVTKAVIQPGSLSLRSQKLAAFALTGFANFASIGIQIGGIGAMAPERRADLARLGLKALFAGFVATLLNASLAGILMKQ